MKGWELRGFLGVPVWETWEEFFFLFLDGKTGILSSWEATYF